MTAPLLVEVLDILHEIAPLELAAEWDNVGVLVETQPRQRPCRRVLLTVDLTMPVAIEAARGGVDLIVSYHPPIFHGLKRLSAADPGQAALMAAVGSGATVYSPHTALDAAPGGMADWLAEGLCGGAAPKLLRPCGDGEFGRFVELKKSVALPAMLRRIKQHLGVKGLRVAAASARLRAVRTFAVAAGSGASVLRGEAADLWLTGEMSHHDALAAAQAGTTVVLAEHSNSERGYLPMLARRLRDAFGKGLRVDVSRQDRDPFAVV